MAIRRRPGAAPTSCRGVPAQAHDRVTEIGAGGGVKGRGAVPDRARDGVVDSETVHLVTEDGATGGRGREWA